MSQWKMLDFVCPDHGKFEVLCDKRDGKPEHEICPARPSLQDLPGQYTHCGVLSPVVI